MIIQQINDWNEIRTLVYSVFDIKMYSFACYFKGKITTGSTMIEAINNMIQTL